MTEQRVTATDIVAIHKKLDRQARDHQKVLANLHKISANQQRLLGQMHGMDVLLRGSIDGEHLGMMQRMAIAETEIKSSRDARKWAMRTLIAAIMTVVSGLVVLAVQLKATAGNGESSPQTVSSMGIAIQFLLLSAALGLVTQLIKRRLKKVGKLWTPPPWINTTLDVIGQRLIPYGLALLLWVFLPGIYESVGHSMGLASDWYLVVGILAAGLSSLSYSVIRDWARK